MRFSVVFVQFKPLRRIKAQQFTSSITFSRASFHFAASWFVTAAICITGDIQLIGFISLRGIFFTKTKPMVMNNTTLGMDRSTANSDGIISNNGSALWVSNYVPWLVKDSSCCKQTKRTPAVNKETPWVQSEDNSKAETSRWNPQSTSTNSTQAIQRQSTLNFIASKTDAIHETASIPTHRFSVQTRERLIDCWLSIQDN